MMRRESAHCERERERERSIKSVKNALNVNSKQEEMNRMKWEKVKLKKSTVTEIIVNGES